jgi:predicted nucleotidyltransferase
MLLGEEDLASVVDRIVAHYDPDRVYLFGSYAKGTMTRCSDIDILVIRSTTVPFQLRGRNVSSLLASIPAHVDLVYFTPEEVAEELTDPNGFLATIIGDARLMYERGHGPVALQAMERGPD